MAADQSIFCAPVQRPLFARRFSTLEVDEVD
jgi:hypothetical protein